VKWPHISEVVVPVDILFVFTATQPPSGVN